MGFYVVGDCVSIGILVSFGLSRHKVIHQLIFLFPGQKWITSSRMLLEQALHRSIITTCPIAYQPGTTGNAKSRSKRFQAVSSLTRMIELDDLLLEFGSVVGIGVMSALSHQSMAQVHLLWQLGCKKMKCRES
jgi:hypothetical protein